MTGVGATTQPIRVLFVTGAYFPELSSGGLQCQAVARTLRGRIDAVTLTTSTDSSLPSRDLVEGMPVSRVPIDVASRWQSALAGVRMAMTLLRLVPRVDLVHLHGFSRKNILVSAVARLFARPVVLSLHTARHDEPAVVAAQGRLANWAFRSADFYLSVSPRLVETYLAAGLPADRVQQAPNGVDVERFSPAGADERMALRRTHGLPPDRPMVLFVGIISRDKQPRVLFDAWRSLQQHPACASTLVLVGAASPRQFEADAGIAADIRREAVRSGDGGRVVFVEPTPAIQDYYRAADVFVLPSAREGLPVALLEAMACGLPCIASRLPGATDVIVDDGVNGRLVEPGDVAALAAALTSVLLNPGDAARLGASARRTVEERYNITRTAEHWLAAYRRVLAST